MDFIANKLKYSLVFLLTSSLLLSSCASASDASSSLSSSLETGESASVSAQPEAEPVEDAQTDRAIIKMMLPSGQSAVSNVLAQVAEAQNVDLQVLAGGNEPQYTEELIAALTGDEPPDLFWLSGEGSARLLDAAGVAPYDLRQEEAGMALYSLADMSPEASRLLDFEKVYALPLGVYAEGTLVNLPLLGALLGTKDLATLQRDLAYCDYEEWQVLQMALADYLTEPSKYQFTLNGHTYTTPRYRPEEAASLRGIWALPTANAGAFAQNNLGMVYAAGFVDTADLLDTDPAYTNQILQSPLEAMFWEIEFETQHMTGEEGAFARGEEFQPQSRITSAAARQLFIDGNALLMKGDTRQALVMEQESPSLYGKLFVIPTKMPIAEEVSILNTLYGTKTDGYLCAAGEAQAAGATGDLLVQLYTDPTFITAIEQELYVLPYTDLYPSVPLLTALEEAIGLGDIYVLPLSQGELSIMEGRIGDWLNTTLMEKEEWTEEDLAAFLTATQGLLGSNYEEAAEE